MEESGIDEFIPPLLLRNLQFGSQNEFHRSSTYRAPHTYSWKCKSGENLFAQACATIAGIHVFSPEIDG